MPKTVKPLSERRIDAAKIREKAYKLSDGGGLLLLIEPNGSKRWRYKYRFAGKEKMLSFGSYPEISLSDARCSRDAARELLMQGIDPSVSRKESKARERAERLEAEMTPSIRVTIDGKIEIWKGGNTMRLSGDEARFVANLFNNILR